MAYRTVNSSLVIAYAGGVPQKDLRLQKREFMRYVGRSVHYSAGRTLVQFGIAGMRQSNFDHKNYNNIMASVPQYKDRIEEVEEEEEVVAKEEEEDSRKRREANGRGPSYSDSAGLSNFRGDGHYRLSLHECTLSPSHLGRHRREAGRKAPAGAASSSLRAHINNSELSLGVHFIYATFAVKVPTSLSLLDSESLLLKMRKVILINLVVTYYIYAADLSRSAGLHQSSIATAEASSRQL